MAYGNISFKKECFHSGIAQITSSIRATWSLFSDVKNDVFVHMKKSTNDGWNDNYYSDDDDDDNDDKNDPKTYKY